MNTLRRVARRELAVFFATPAAFIFFGAFLAATLFIFFWVETFFSRNLADVRPMFEWMPLLLIFLSAAITMRVWSEEHRAGTLEPLLTAPVKLPTLVLGKFLACLGLVAIALVLTLPLPLTVSLLGQLDWGPVLGGYLASLFLAGAYIAIGLFVSAQFNSQIVSLIVSTLVCSILYMVGSDTLTGFFGSQVGELLKLLGAGSRFDAITRGVIDLRDLAYCFSLIGIFLSLNIYSLERQRWAGNPANMHHRRWGYLASLLALNFLCLNFWLAPIGTLRTDLTQGKIYSISPATRGYLSRLQEPLLIRGYFSAQTHPLLAPLQPQLKDLLREYEVAGKGKVRVEFVDPQEKPALEQEAGEKYGIRPVPFQTASRYQTAVTNSYFDVLIKYGDEFVTLGFQDLIEVKSESDTKVEVDLRNPEHDITRAIKKVLYSYQGGGNLFAGVGAPVTFHGYISPEASLPEPLIKLKKSLTEVLTDLQQEGGQKFSYDFADPEAKGGELGKELTQKFGMQPMVAGLMSTDTFWFYMTLESGGQQMQVALPSSMDKAGLKGAIEASLKRFSKGMLKTVALYTPPPQAPAMNMFGMGGQQTGATYNLLQRFVEQEHKIVPEDLKDGQVDPEADILVLVSPDHLDTTQLFAVDQFLMQGGTVVLASSAFDVSLQGRLDVSETKSGLQDWLASYGLNIDHSMVLDSQNAAFPIPVERQVGGYTIQETHLINYPYFVDIRNDGMDRTSGLITGIEQLSLTWASPIHVDAAQNKTRQVATLLQSSPNSWTSDSLAVQPDFERFGELGFAKAEQTGRQPLAVMVEGRFDSWFTGKTSPLVEAARKAKAEEKKAKQNKETEQQPPAQEKKEPAKEVIGRVVDRSPDSARLIVLGSNTFLNDTSLQLASGANGSQYLNSLQLLTNTIDWSLEDRDLLSIQGRGHFARTLHPMGKTQRMIWEYLNYGLAAAGLLLVWLVRRLIRTRAQRREQLLIAGRA